MRGRNGSWHRYYYCRNHDPIRAGGADRRCPERNIRAEALDSYVFDRIRSALLDPDTLLAGEQAVAARTPAPDDELLAAELARLERKITAADDERRRLADLYQAGLLALPEVQRPAADLEHTAAPSSPAAATTSPPNDESLAATIGSAAESKDSPDESLP